MAWLHMLHPMEIFVFACVCMYQCLAILIVCVCVCVCVCVSSTHLDSYVCVSCLFICMICAWNHMLHPSQCKSFKALSIQHSMYRSSGHMDVLFVCFFFKTFLGIFKSWSDQTRHNCFPRCDSYISPSGWGITAFFRNQMWLYQANKVFLFFLLFGLCGACQVQGTPIFELSVLVGPNMQSLSSFGFHALFRGIEPPNVHLGHEAMGFYFLIVM